MMKLLLLLIFLNCSSQKREFITYENKKYKVVEVLMLYNDTIYKCNEKTIFRYTKNFIYIYKPKYYKKIKNEKK